MTNLLDSNAVVEQYIPQMGDTSIAAETAFNKLALLSAGEVTEAAKVTAKPTWSQAIVGNYRKGKFKWHGLEIAIENARGTIRTAVDKSWSFLMRDHYGYFVGSRSQADGDPVDVFISTWDIRAELAFVINQKTKGGAFDEHKVVVGVATAAQAAEVYKRNYPADWKGLGSIVPMTVPQLSWWLKHADTASQLPSDFWMTGLVKVAEHDPLLCGCKGTIKAANVDNTYGICDGCGKPYFDFSSRLARREA